MFNYPFCLSRFISLILTICSRQESSTFTYFLLLLKPFKNCSTTHPWPYHIISYHCMYLVNNGLIYSSFNCNALDVLQCLSIIFVVSTWPYENILPNLSQVFLHASLHEQFFMQRKTCLWSLYSSNISPYTWLNSSSCYNTWANTYNNIICLFPCHEFLAIDGQPKLSSYGTNIAKSSKLFVAFYHLPSQQYE